MAENHIIEESDIPLKGEAPEATNGEADAEADKAALVDKQRKKKLLLNVFTIKCALSSNELLQKIHKATSDGNKLKVRVISGGGLNYSYKVFVEKRPDL